MWRYGVRLQATVLRYIVDSLRERLGGDYRSSAGISSTSACLVVICPLLRLSLLPTSALLSPAAVIPYHHAVLTVMQPDVVEMQA